MEKESSKIKDLSEQLIFVGQSTAYREGSQRRYRYDCIDSQIRFESNSLQGRDGLSRVVAKCS